MFMLSHPIRWLKIRLSGSKLSSTAVIRGVSNISVGRGVRVGRLSELNSSKGNITLGDGVCLAQFCLIEARGGNIAIGENTSVSPFCVLYGHGGLSIGKDCLIAAGSTFIPATHVFEDVKKSIRSQGETAKGITIGDNVWIAARVTVLDGVKIGDGAVVGAGSVVNQDIPPYSVAVGVPAKVIRVRR